MLRLSAQRRLLNTVLTQLGVMRQASVLIRTASVRATDTADRSRAALTLRPADRRVEFNLSVAG